MINEISLLFFQQYWWLIVSVLGAALVFLLFVQGGQTLIYQIGKTETERNIIVNTLGRKWEFTFTTLVTFGGAFFASFPLFYSSSFGGAYWLWITILLAFTIQAVSYEFRSKPNNVLGKKTFEIMLFINGLFGTVLLGVVVGTLFNGVPFELDSLNRVSWHGLARGLEAILNLHNLSLGLTVFFLARILAILYFINSIEQIDILKRSKKHLIYNTIPFIVFFLSFVIYLLIKDGFAVDPTSGIVSMQSFKYLNNLLQMPVLIIIFVLGVVGVLYGILNSIFSKKIYDKGIWFAGIGTFLVVLTLFLIAGYNNTAFYPSLHNINDSLTIQNASSSLYTLKTMSIVSLLVPFVIAYIVFAWRLINKKKITEDEINDKNEHTY
ncbi:MAG: cytochrome d ubiquinol oxidase subunit II [Bacteroidales bacterium]|jgi:cytochrome d ubiquinol oxidase subunit II|nr:cytochrome d ubiquinol oxidase subunit II [Bacteroidales bacterium]MDD4234812.1 cytochrome d ubiquinol oxidase subunit II [Bacteroidales bacterium]